MPCTIHNKAGKKVAKIYNRRNFQWLQFWTFPDISRIFNFWWDLISPFWPVRYNFLWYAMHVCRIHLGIVSGSEINEN